MEGDARNGHKTCVLSEWLTALCAPQITLTEWDSLALGKHMVLRHRKMLKLFKANHKVATKNDLTISVKEQGNKQVTRSFFVDLLWILTLSQSSCGTLADVRDLFIATTAKEIPRRDWLASAISKLKFSNTNLKMFFPWCMIHWQGTYEMKYRNTQF